MEVTLKSDPERISLQESTDQDGKTLNVESKKDEQGTRQRQRKRSSKSRKSLLKKWVIKRKHTSPKRRKSIKSTKEPG